MCILHRTSCKTPWFQLGSSLVPLGSLSAAHANGAGGVAKIAWFQLGSTLVPRFAMRISLSRGCKNRLAPAWFRNAPCAFCALGAAQVKSGRGTGRRSKNALKRNKKRSVKTSAPCCLECCFQIKDLMRIPFPDPHWLDRDSPLTPFRI